MGLTTRIDRGKGLGVSHADWKHLWKNTSVVRSAILGVIMDMSLTFLGEHHQTSQFKCHMMVRKRICP